MHTIDFTSWHAGLTTLLGLALFTLIGVGIRVLMMQVIQQRRERMNRQINERLKTLIAAYKTLGGSFTGQLAVDPTHLRDVRTARQDSTADDGVPRSSERSRRIRDAVEAALADILLLGTAEHCRLAGQAARDLAAGRPIHTAELVTSLRDFIRKALDLEAIPADVAIPLQGPARSQGSGGRGREGGTKGGGNGGGGNGGMGAGMNVDAAHGDHPEHGTG